MKPSALDFNAVGQFLSVSHNQHTWMVKTQNRKTMKAQNVYSIICT